MMMVAGTVLAAASCTEFSDYNAVDPSADLSADKTLWENIQSNAILSDFAQVLKQVGYDKILSESHTYTVWAPVNGSFNVDSLNKLSKQKIIKEFVQNMVANYSHPETDINDTTVFMLNEKLLKFSGKNTPSLAFDGKKILSQTSSSAFNCPSTNGLLYTVTHPATFRNNGYEIITEEKALASNLHAMVMKYHKEVLDEKNSIKGEIINGMQVYDDSVKIITNSFVESTLRAQLRNEDSLYTVLIPTDEAWQEAYNRIAPYYKYLPEMVYQNLSSQDMGVTKGGGNTAAACFMKAGLGQMTTKLTAAPSDSKFETSDAYWTDSLAKRFITRDLVYSETNKRYNSKFLTGESFVEGDTLYSTTRDYLTNAPALDKATTSVRQLSNGHARIIDKLPFKSWETYAPKIKSRSVGRCVTATGNGYSMARVTGDLRGICQFDDPDETDLYYVRANVPEGNAFAPELDFALPNVLSTTYDIYAVVVPAWIEHIGEEDFVRKPYTLRFDINYTNEKNEEIRARFDGEQAVSVATQAAKIPAVLCGQEKVDTVKLGRVTFPVCYRGTEAYPNIKVFCTLTNFGSANRAKFEQQIRIANIIMKPIDLVEYEEKLNAIKEED